VAVIGDARAVKAGEGKRGQGEDGRYGDGQAGSVRRRAFRGTDRWAARTSGPLGVRAASGRSGCVGKARGRATHGVSAGQPECFSEALFERTKLSKVEYKCTQ
jgi:hypothetical protein